MAEERNVRARFEVETTGDADAFGRAAEGLETLEDAAGKTAEGLGTLEDAARGAGEGARDLDAFGEVSTLLERAGERVREFERRVEAGGDGVVEFSERARREIDRLLEKTRDLRRSGQGLTDEHVAELEQLERQYRETLESLDKYTKAQKEADRGSRTAARGAAELSGSYGSLLDVAGDLGDGGAKLASNLGSVVEAFQAGYAAGNALREALGTLDDALETELLPHFDQFIQKWSGASALAQNLFGPENTPARQAEELANILNILRGKGIEPVSTDLEALRAQLANLAEEEGRVARETLAVRIETEKWAEGLGLSKKALDETAAELAKFVTQFQEQNDAIDGTALGEAIKPQLQDLLDGYRQLGTEAPAAVQKIADAFGIVDSATEAALEKQRQLVDEYAGQLREALGTVAEDAAERSVAIQEAIGQISLEQVQFLSPEKRAEFKETFEGMVEQVRAAGGPITREMVEIGNSVGLLLTEMAPLSPEADRMSQSLRQAGQSLRDASRGAGELGAALPGDEARSAATGFEDLAGRSGDLRGELESLAGSSVEGASAITEQGQAAEQAARGTGQAAQETDKLAQAQDAGAKKSAELSENLGKIAEISTGVEKAAGAIVAALEKLGGLDLATTRGALEQLLGLLDRVEQKARTTGAALAEALAADGGPEA